ncbi:hypothetical protein AB4622_22435 [Vibrio splendidus]
MMIASKIFNASELISAVGIASISPDSHVSGLFIEPTDDFVLCRDKGGVTTAKFGGESWDFNPYRLSARKISKITFTHNVSECDKELPHYSMLIREQKLLLFKIIYHSDGGHAGFYSPASINKYNYAIRDVVEFIMDSGTRSFMGELCIADVLSNHQYIVKAIKSNGKKNFVPQLSALLRTLESINRNILGFHPAEVKIEKIEHKQHPVIPPRIHLNFINHNAEWMERADKDLQNIEDFIVLLSDRTNYFGKDKLKVEERRKSGVEYKNFVEILDEWGLLEFLKEEMNIEDESNLHRVKFVNFLGKVQRRLKCIIHLYTGMRDEEVNRMPFDCIAKEVMKNAIILEGKELVPEKTIKLISATTKYTGYMKSASWIAPPEVLKAVEILQRIVRGLAKYNNVEPSECYLINSVTSINAEERFEKKAAVGKSRHDPFKDNKEFTITGNDFSCLQSTDPERDFTSEEKFSVGEIWPFTTHQFRRSLAYYATNSGFVSLPSLKRQFKHILIEITKYYGKNFGNMKTIFGYYDEKIDKFILPKGHIALEVQTGIPMAVAEDILREVFGSDTVLFGKAGAYIERQKSEQTEDEISIIKHREDTLKRAENGEISYSPTLLGGCTKVGGCDCAMLGEFTDCLTSECAIIKPDSVLLQIEHLEKYIQQYDESTGEYQVLISELETLKKYHEFNTSKVD